tara:strand:- start:346 stop:639 length:294 start_codon:yes stop_codon:yes gene_type:complete
MTIRLDYNGNRGKGGRKSTYPLAPYRHVGRASPSRYGSERAVPARQVDIMAKYRVVIPYYYEFFVEAKNAVEAINEAHNSEGNCTGYDDDNALVEEQ